MIRHCVGEMPRWSRIANDRGPPRSSTMLENENMAARQIVTTTVAMDTSRG